MGAIRSKKRGHLECDTEGCEAKSETYDCRNAAWALDLCEQAHAQEGWGYTVGFFSMLVGPETYCPKHARPDKPAA